MSFRGKGLALATAIGTAAAIGLTNGRAAGQVPAVSASPPAAGTSAKGQVVESLREIGHVKARTPFCSELLKDGAPAAEGAVAFEFQLLATARDLRGVRMNDGLQKALSMHRLEDDLARLNALSQYGRSDLQGLRSLADDSSSDEAKAVLGYRDALDGAKARQIELTRKVADTISTLEAMPNFTTMNLPIDHMIGSRNLTEDVNKMGDLNDTKQAQFEAQAMQGLFSVGPDDEQIEGDLAHAGQEATRALALGNCDSP